MRQLKVAVVALAMTMAASVRAAEPADPNPPPTAPPPAEVKPEAEVEAPTDGTSGRGAFLAGVKVGGFVAFSKLGPNARVAAEVGYVLPWLKEAFAVTVEVAYASPQSSGVQEGDPRVGGSYNWHLNEQQLTVMPNLVVRLTMFGRVVPYLGVGPRIYMLQSTTKGDVGGNPILETKEQSTKVGFGAPLGVQFKLGPGALNVELLTEWGPLDHTATGNSNTGAETLQIGYRFLL